MNVSLGHYDRKAKEVAKYHGLSVSAYFKMHVAEDFRKMEREQNTPEAAIKGLLQKTKTQNV